MVGKQRSGRLGRGIVTFGVAFAVAIPVAQAAGSTALPAGPAPRTIRADIAAQVAGPAIPPAHGFDDPVAKVSFDPPAGWLRGPDTALNPVSDPAEPVLELVRYQVRVGDPALYAQPIPLTSGLIADAGAVISIGLAREGGEVADLEVDPRAEREVVRSVAGFTLLNEERTYEGLHVYTRYLLARATERRIVLRAVVPEDDWAANGPLVIAALDTFRAADDVANAPPAPPPVAAAPDEAAVQATAIVDPSLAARADIIARAAALLGTPYVWGGNRPNVGMDCGAYVSAALGVPWHTTDALWQITGAIDREELRAGDLMNLTTGRDPDGYGHVRMFDAWANVAHTLVWVYEETPPRAVHRVIAYDARYQPLRLAGLSGAGPARLVPAPAADPAPRFVPAPARTAHPAASPAPRRTYAPVHTIAPAPKRTATPWTLATPRPVATPRPSVRVAPAPTGWPKARR